MGKKEKEVKTNAMRILEKEKIAFTSHTYECTEFTDGAQIAEASGRKLRHEDVFNYFRRELASLEPPIDTPEAFKSALRARTNRISRKKSH